MMGPGTVLPPQSIGGQGNQTRNYPLFIKGRSRERDIISDRNFINIITTTIHKITSSEITL